MYRAVGLILCLACAASVVSAANAADEKPVWLAVGRPGLVEGLGPLAQKRRGEGMETVVSTAAVGEAIAGLKRRPSYVLLVGDDEAGQEGRSWYLGAKREKLYRWREVQPEEYTSDAAWGDLDGDGTPEVPVGRIPARTREEVDLVVGKILAYEGAEPTEDDLRLPTWGGSPEYGATVDNLAANMLVSAISYNSPKWATPWVIFGNAGHALCGWGPDQPRLFTEEMKRGGAMVVLMGHASAERFHSMDGVDYGAAETGGMLNEGKPTGPMVVFSCESGDFARAGRSMTEAFLLMRGGPVAAIGATTESHPLTNYYSGISLLKEMGGKHRRLGDLWLATQRAAARSRNVLMDKLLSDVEGKLEGEINIAALKRDQLLMYALMGDPATRLRFPETLEVTVERKGKGWVWKATKPKGARQLHVGVRPVRLTLPKGAQGRDEAEARRVLAEANAVFEYSEAGTFGARGRWTGKVEKEGWVRFVATGGGKIYVATVKLERPVEGEKAK